MDELKPLICQSCGGHIDRRTMKCPFCDTQYNGKIEPVPIEPLFVADGCETLAISIQIPEEQLLRSANEMLYVQEEMCKLLAKRMMPYLKVRENRNPMNFDRIFTGLIKFVKP